MLAERLFKILVVDDDFVDREIYKQCLRSVVHSNFEFAEADSAAAGIELVRQFQPDCILLDYDLPDKNGLEVLSHVSQNGHTGAVVMLTAYGGEDLAVRAMKAGVTDYLPKRQVNAESLAYTVTNAIQKFEMQRRIEQHRAALERSERRYETLLEAMPQMVWTADGQGFIKYANRRWLDYTGLDPENTGPLGWDELLHPDDSSRTWDAWRAAAEAGSVFEIEHRLRRASDQAYRWHLVRAVPMKNREGEVIDWFGTATEVEDQKQAEVARQNKEKLEGLGLLAGGIAHDFNNLLVSILGGASFVLETLPETHPARLILNNVVCAGERAAELTRKMLAYSGRGSFYVEALDLDRLIREACRSLRSGVPERIELRCEGQLGLPAVQSDGEQLRRIIVELVTNAVDAIGDQAGTIQVRSRCVDVDPDFARDAELSARLAAGERFVALEVQDSGCGMDAETQSKVFDPFYSTKFTGRGLGLAAVKGVVRSNGGAIRVRSKPGEGALFQILLPVATSKVHRSAAGEDQ